MFIFAAVASPALLVKVRKKLNCCDGVVELIRYRIQTEVGKNEGKL